MLLVGLIEGRLNLQLHNIHKNNIWKTEKKIEQTSLLCSHYQKIIINIKYVHNITIYRRPLFYKNRTFNISIIRIIELMMWGNFNFESLTNVLEVLPLKIL